MLRHMADSQKEMAQRSLTDLDVGRKALPGTVQVRRRSALHTTRVGRLDFATSRLAPGVVDGLPNGGALVWAS
jgi:hypothetical protein